MVVDIVPQMGYPFKVDVYLPGRTMLRGFTGPIDYEAVPADRTTLHVFNYDDDLHLDQIPAHVTDLELSHCSGLRTFTGIAPHLESVEVYNCLGLESLADLPEGLRKFTVNHYGECRWHMVRDGREVNKINSIYDMSLLPRSVREVKLKGLDELTSIEGLPEQLSKLTLTNLSKLEDLTAVPCRIQDLTVHKCPVVAGLPFREDIVRLDLGYGPLMMLTPGGVDVISEVKVQDLAEYQALIHEYLATVIARKKGAHTARLGVHQGSRA